MGLESGEPMFEPWQVFRGVASFLRRLIELATFANIQLSNALKVPRGTFSGNLFLHEVFIGNGDNQTGMAF